MTLSMAESNTITNGDHSNNCPNNSGWHEAPLAMIKAGSWSSRTIWCEDIVIFDFI
jgi:hypothetical protein